LKVCFSQVNAGVFYVAPATKYAFDAAVAARDEAPFFAVWFCGGFQDNAAREAAVASIEKRAAKARTAPLPPCPPPPSYSLDTPRPSPRTNRTRLKRLPAPHPRFTFP
jgi:hypothetical protein